MRTARPPHYSLRVAVAAGLMLCLLGARSNGFRDYTYESNRRAAVARAPVALDNWPLQGTDGRTLRLDAIGDQLLLVDFIYTRCPTVCRALGSRYRQLQRRLDQLGSDAVLISISIDPEHDTPARLADYRSVHRGLAHNWWLARPTSQAVLQHIMAQTGVRVIDDGLGGYTHSDKIHLILNGQLLAIEDWDSPELERWIEALDVLQL